MSLTLKKLKSVLSYDPLTGVFRWKIKPRQRACSEIAGGVNPDGYRMICVSQRIYRAHRLAWFYMTGRWPKGEVDHINGTKDDNRIANLRIADKQENQANSKRRSTNTTGFKGICVLQGRDKKYCARITVNYKVIWLGNFYTAEEAHAAYFAAAKKYFGEFARAA